MFTLEALKNEIVVDPEGLGYKNADDTWTGGANTPKDDQDIADLVNALNFIVDPESVSMEDVRGPIDLAWYDALSPDEQEFLRWKTPNGGALRVTPDIKLHLTGRELTVNGVAGSGGDADSWWAPPDRTPAVKAMLLIFELVGSRGHVLWGVGLTVTARDVGAAFNLV